MAVLPGIPGLSVSIRVEGEIATEYEDPDEHPPCKSGARSTHCLIESKAGAEFNILMTLTPDYVPIPGHTNVYAHPIIDSDTLHGESIYHGHRWSRTRTAVHAGAYTPSNIPYKINKSHFVFTPIMTCDSQDTLYLHDPDAMKWLGTIRVMVVSAIHQGSGAEYVGPEKKGNLEIPEKLLKGRDLVHGPCLSASTLIHAPRFAVNHGHLTVGMFYFHCRSHKALQAQMIIPRTPSPAMPVPKDDGLSRLSEAEIRRLASERLREVKVKNEGPLKREPESPPMTLRPLKMVKLDDGKEAIDLTEDE
ncbi:hypothetical protein B0J13DRAFT_521506 [Dactylonectria estremocensis]|uniref:DUF7918 domain-containing protein n=1 Tax=Dactylonectria estremocensis TaxID=1079267 RepID=A0A9P9F7F5_9HYPO|nr:hypothetical protein B0J13DRAFT_521506 [Dactylonectria estremocensis]